MEKYKRATLLIGIPQYQENIYVSYVANLGKIWKNIKKNDSVKSWIGFDFVTIESKAQIL